MKFGYQLACAVPICVFVHSLLSLPAVGQFSQQAKLVGTGAIGNADQGTSVSLSGDGHTAIVGGPTDNTGTVNNAGAAWVFVGSHEQWTQQAKLVGTGAIGNADQGFSVSLSSGGNTAIVSGPFDNHNVGAAWIFQRSFNREWKQEAKLVPAGTPFGIEAGYSASISGDGNTAIIGAPFANGEIGAGFVFVRRHGIWNQQAELIGTGVTGPFSTQGTSVALSGDGNTAVIGGFNDNNRAGSPVGAAWVFERSHGVWRQQAKLVGTGAIGTPFQGQSVSLSEDGNTAIVGGYGDNGDLGAAWAFQRSGGVWTQQGPKLVGSAGVGPSVFQGYSVSLSGSGNTAIVGGWADNGNVGATWVFERSGSVWTQQGSKLVGNNAIGNAGQGLSVSLSGDGNIAIMGGPFDDGIGSVDFAGAVWVFSREPVFAGRPGNASCDGQSVSALARQYGGLSAAAVELGFASVDTLQNAIVGFCEG